MAECRQRDWRPPEDLVSGDALRGYDRRPRGRLALATVLHREITSFAALEARVDRRIGQGISVLRQRFRLADLGWSRTVDWSRERLGISWSQCTELIRDRFSLSFQASSIATGQSTERPSSTCRFAATLSSCWTHS